MIVLGIEARWRGSTHPVVDDGLLVHGLIEVRGTLHRHRVEAGGKEVDHGGYRGCLLRSTVLVSALVRYLDPAKQGLAVFHIDTL